MVLNCRTGLLVRHSVLFFQVSDKTRKNAARIVLIKSAIKLNNFFQIRLQLHGAIYRPDFFVMMLPDCTNLKAIKPGSHITITVPAVPAVVSKPE